MPERTSLSAGVQVGVETTPGTGVTGSKKLQSLSFALTPQIETNRFRPMGTKVDTLVTPAKDWTQVDMTGQPTYDEIIYAMAMSLVTPGAPSTVLTTGKLWTFEPNALGADTLTTLTIEQGDGVRAQKATGAILTDFGINISRDNAELSGSGIARQFTDAITMTASPTAIPLVPILPKDFSVYIDTTAAGLGTTKMLRLFEAELSVGGRVGPVWPLNAANASFDATVETEPDFTLRLLMEADAAGMAYLSSIRAGTTVFPRVEAVGGVIGAGTAVYKYTQDCAIKFEELSNLDDTDGIYTVEWSGRLVYDATWAKFLSIKVVNSTSAL